MIGTSDVAGRDAPDYPLIELLITAIYRLRFSLVSHSETDIYEMEL
jgi:hypothetical protein